MSLAIEPGALASLAHPTLKLTLSVLVVAYAGTVFGFGIWSRLLSHYSAATVAPFALLVPVVGMATAPIVFGEPIGAIELAGAVLVMAGLAFNVFGERFWPSLSDGDRNCHARHQSHPRQSAGLRRRARAPRPRGRAQSLIALDEQRRAAIAELQRAQERRNFASKEIGAAMARKDKIVADALRDEMAKLKVLLPELEAAEKAPSMVLDNELAAIPNLPAADTPDGKDENDNVEVRRSGSPPEFPAGFKPKEHFEIGEALGLMDFDAAAKLSGARFVVLKGALARLSRALEQFMLDLHTGEHGYTEIEPPVLVRDDDAMFGTAQLPKMFRANSVRRRRRVSGSIPTAEVPLTNLVRESIVDEKTLAPSLHRRDAVLPRRSGRGGARHARHDPPASVQEGRTRLDHDAGTTRPPNTSA